MVDKRYDLCGHSKKLELGKGEVLNKRDFLSRYVIDAKFESACVLSRQDYEDDPDNCIQEISGEIKYMETNKETEEITKIEIVGGFVLKLIDGDLAVNNEINLFDLYDSSQELMNIYNVIYDKRTEFFSQALEEAVGETVRSDRVLLIERLALLPEHRHKGLGLHILQNIIQHYSLGAGTIVIEPAPFEFTDSSIMNSGEFEWRLSDQNKESTQKLVEYYSKVGFRPIPGSKYMAMSMA